MFDLNKELIRKPAVAGSFYPSDPEELKEMVDGFLRDAKSPKIDGELKAIIVPHAGYVYSGPTAGYGFKLLENTDKNNFILIGPSHHAAFEGFVQSKATAWQTPLGLVKTSRYECEDDTVLPMFNDLVNAHAPEHCLEVEVPFLQRVCKKEFAITPILTGELDPKKVADALFESADKDAFWIVSSDLSHYLSYDKAVKTDSESSSAIQSLNTLWPIDACGNSCVLIIMHIAKKMNWKCKLLDYRNSGDTAGSKTNVVGYGAYAFYE
ncbi:MAG: AmmeMemoRadiSam system protein B [Candidatus Micrarchaeota archaeon]